MFVYGGLKNTYIPFVRSQKTTIGLTTLKIIKFYLGETYVDLAMSVSVLSIKYAGNHIT